MVSYCLLIMHDLLIVYLQPVYTSSPLANKEKASKEEAIKDRGSGSSQYSSPPILRPPFPFPPPGIGLSRFPGQPPFPRMAPHLQPSYRHQPPGRPFHPHPHRFPPPHHHQRPPSPYNWPRYCTVLISDHTHLPQPHQKPHHHFWHTYFL